MDDELNRQVALAKAAVREARARAIEHVQAAQSQMDHDVSSLQYESLERLQYEMHSRTLEVVWQAWASEAPRRARAKRLLGKALARREERGLRAHFTAWLTARRVLAKERTHMLREEVEELELQLRRVQGGTLPGRQSDAALGSPTAALQAQLRRAERETTALELQQTIAQETARERQRVLAARRADSALVESELAAHQAELDDNLSAASDAGSLSVDDDAEIRELRALARYHELQLVDALSTRTQAERDKDARLETLEDEMNRQVRLHESAKLHEESLEQQLAEHEAELEQHESSARRGTSTPRAGAATDGLRGDLAHETALREEGERRLQEQERAVLTSELELAEANAAAEAAIGELHSATAELKYSMDDQLLEESRTAKALELRTAATRREVDAHEGDLIQSRAALQHTEEGK